MNVDNRVWSEAVVRAIRLKRWQTGMSDLGQSYSVGTDPGARVPGTASRRYSRISVNSSSGKERR